MQGIDVVVACAEGREPHEECIAALRREVGDSLRIVTEHFAWQARQRAAADSRSDVIAFVDPDVVVADGWLAALRIAWETSPHTIGAVGGPIRAREDVREFARARLGLIDLGADMLELDPIERTLFAGNLSFWRRALIGTGGFHPPVDRRDATDWLSEEHEAQRQLGHWGWLLRYAPGVSAERIVGAPRPVGRAWRHGVRSGIAGSRSAGAAFQQGMRSGAGSLGSLVRGRRGEAVERAARAAENLGVVAGARRASQPGRTAAHPAPATPSTSATHSVANVDLVLLYHRFAEGEPDPLGLCVAPRHLEEQLRVLRDEFEVVPLEEIARTVREGGNGAGRI